MEGVAPTHQHLSRSAQNLSCLPVRNSGEDQIDCIPTKYKDGDVP